MTRRVPIEDTASVLVARQAARELAASLELPVEAQERAALVVSELGHNQLRHARLGEVEIRPVRRGDHDGLHLIATDTGDGLADPIQAFRGTLRLTGEGLGVGLAAVRRASTSVDVHTRRGEGLVVEAHVFAQGTRVGLQYAVVGHPHPDEPRSGDDAIVLRTADRVVAVLADGLGHGPEARRAATLACQCCRDHADWAVDRMLSACDAALRGTRGSAVAAAAIDLRTDTVSVSIAGNVRVGLYDAEQGQRFAYTPCVLGRGQGRTLRTMSLPRHGRTLILFTDGLPERTDPTVERPAIAGWPLSLASRLLDRFDQGRDDATVIALR